MRKSGCACQVLLVAKPRVCEAVTARREWDGLLSEYRSELLTSPRDHLTTCALPLPTPVHGITHHPVHHVPWQVTVYVSVTWTGQLMRTDRSFNDSKSGSEKDSTFMKANVAGCGWPFG